MDRRELGQLLNLKEELIPVGRKNRSGLSIRPTHITIHNTSNTGRGADARAHSRFVRETGHYVLASGNKNWVSWHYTVDDKMVIKHLPINEKAIHAGAGNGKSIGIEICMHQGIDQQAANLRAARLVAALMFDLGISIDNVVRHKDWTGKQCPILLLDRWSDFQRQIQEVHASIRSGERMLVSDGELEAARSAPVTRSRKAEPDLDHDLLERAIRGMDGVGAGAGLPARGGNEVSFPRLSAEELSRFAEAFSRHARRAISEIHLHHTASPDAESFRRLADVLGSEEAAGQELLRRIQRVQTEQLGFGDIAQHLTIMPDGSIWLGRPWDRPPVSATGFNGSASRGPLMVTLLGDFATETPTQEALSAAAAAIAALRKAFDLPAGAVLLHSDLSPGKGCPGTLLDRRNLMDRVEVALSDLSTAKRGADGPLPYLQETIHQSIEWMQRRAATTAEPDADEIASEPEEEPGVIAAEAEVGTRGIRAALPPQVLQQLRRHVINLEQGTYSGDGIFTNTAEDVEVLVNRHLKEWIRARRAAGHEPHVVIYAHGGLVDEQAALRMAANQFRWWLDNGIYPIFFVWETGVLETVVQLIGNALRGERFLGEAYDFMVESAVRALGRPFWSTMKVSAERASDEGKGPDGRPRFGAHCLARLIGALSGQDRPVVHAVGHSAGAILHAYLMRELKEGGVTVKSLQLLAPACTVSLFRQEVMPLIGKGIDHLSLFAMTREAERADKTVRFYGKSLLYLVSRGFERERGTPILGLQESVLADSAVRNLFGLGAGPGGKANAVWSPTGHDDDPPLLRSNSVTHGGFDNDASTMEAALMRVLGRTDMGGLKPFPAEAQRGTMEPLFRSLEDILGEDTLPALQGFEQPVASLPLAGEFPPAPQPAAAAPAVIEAKGARRALSIGIDSYPTSPLSGCVADAELWKKTLQRLGFSVAILPERDATWNGLRERIGNFLDDARAGDQLVLHYSGHGTYLPDADSDEEDARDEALVPIDYEDGQFLIDDDLRALFGRLNEEAQMVAFFDCCHSGSITRLAVGRPPMDPQVKERFLKPDRKLKEAHLAFRRSSGSRSRPVNGAGQEHMRHIQFSACQDYQTAKESGGNGWFTRAATELIRTGAGTLTNLDFQKKLEEEFVRRRYRDQDPRVEGPLKLKEAPFLLTPAPAGLY